MSSKTLIFIPTYNERENAPRICEEIHKLGLDADLLFVDDNSPDGTGAALEECKVRFPRLIVHHRSGKLGIGSAHAEAIEWAYDQGYDLLITMDCDFTHSPADIPRMIAASNSCDVVVGSRWVHENSLPGWNLFRRFMTWLGHFLTRVVLRIPQDASGAFRAYVLRQIPRGIFALIKSRGYAFFFESLFILNRNGMKVEQVPIVLPARTYGNSKMSFSAALRSASYIFELAWSSLRNPERYLVPGKVPRIDSNLSDPQKWSSYWSSQSGKARSAYSVLAGIYRRSLIKRSLEKVLFSEFSKGSKLLHAGCGGGQVDVQVHRAMDITAVDISPEALELYVRNNRSVAEVTHGSILELPFPDCVFDGIYNLGVMEHFNKAEILCVLREFRRVLKPNGRIILFWPHELAISALFLDSLHFVFRRMLKKKVSLHPPEITRCKGRDFVKDLLGQAGFELSSYRFGRPGCFVQAIVIAIVK